MAIDLVTAYGLDMTGETDNASKLAQIATDAAALAAQNRPLPRGVFTQGICTFSSWPNMAYTGVELVAEGTCILKHTGPGDAVSFIGPFNTPLQGAWRILFDNFIIVPNTGHGLVASCCHNSRFRATVMGAGSGKYAIYAPFCVLTKFEPTVAGNLRGLYGSAPDCQGATWPIDGIVFDAYQGLQTTSSDIYLPNIGGCNIGIHYINAGDCNIFGGSSEYCNVGMQIDTGGSNHAWGLEMEGNKQCDVNFGSQAHDNMLWVGPNRKIGSTGGSNNQIRPNWADNIGL